MCDFPTRIPSLEGHRTIIWSLYWARRNRPQVPAMASTDSEQSRSPMSTSGGNWTPSVGTTDQQGLDLVDVVWPGRRSVCSGPCDFSVPNATLHSRDKASKAAESSPSSSRMWPKGWAFTAWIHHAGVYDVCSRKKGISMNSGNAPGNESVSAITANFEPSLEA